IDFSDDVTLRRLSREGGLLRVTLQNAEQPEAGFLTLIFEDDPLILRQWTVRDPQGLETTVVLESLDRGADLDPALFKFDAPLWTDR
ncbi:MAG: outer-membrane lipoprotein carrier protein LolA, partial [Alphaproteobacteria bacterium]